MKKASRTSRKYYIRQILACSLACLMFFGMPVQVALAGPKNPKVVRGRAGIGQNGNTTTVNMRSGRAVINWDSLNTNSKEILRFLKTNGGFAVLNRVVKGGATQFDGSLFGNQGHIVIVNPQGIIFGPTALVQAYKFTASALDISNTDFMNGIYNFAGGGVGKVANYGTISAEQVALIGKSVLNAGVIRSPGGYVLMAAGDRVFLGQEGSDIVVEIDAVTVPQGSSVPDMGDVINEGTVEAAGGKIVLAAGDTFSRAIEGLESMSLAVEGGTGRVGQFGTLNANAAEGDGGSITLTAGEVVVLGADSVTTANGGANGDGGDIVAYSPGTAIFREGARVEAKGGSESGDGGFFELSGKEQVEIEGQINLTAANGENGEFLIDPRNIKIVDELGDPEEGSGTDPWSPNWEWGYSKLDIDVLEGYLNSGNITISTDAFSFLQSGWVKFDAGRDVENTTDNSLTVNADNYIKFYSGSGIDFTGGGDVTLNAGSDIKINADIDLYSGTFSAYSGLADESRFWFWYDPGIGSILVNANIEAGNIILSAGAGLPGYSDSHVTVADGMTLTANRITEGPWWRKRVISAGDITVEAHHDVTLGGAVQADGDLVINADRHREAGGEEHIFGGDVLAKDTLDAGGTIDIYGNNVTLEGDVTSKYDMTITADTSPDFGPQPDDPVGDVVAKGNLESTRGNIDIYADDDTIHLENDYVKAHDNIRLHNNTVADDGVLIKAGDNVETKGTLSGNGDLTVEAGDNILFGDDAGDYVNVEDTLTAKSGLDNSLFFPTWSEGSIEAAGNIRAGDMLLSAGAGLPGFSDSHVSVNGWLMTTSGDMVVEAHHDITLRCNADSAGNLVLNADRHSDWWTPDHMKGGDVLVEGTVDAVGNIDMYGNNITLLGNVGAGGNIVLTADTSSDFEDPLPKGDVRAFGNIISSGGSIDIYSSDSTTYLGGDLIEAADNITLHNNTILDGWGSQRIDAVTGTLTAKKDVRKTRWGGLTMGGGSGIYLAGDVTADYGSLTFEDNITANGAGDQKFESGAKLDHYTKNLHAKGSVTKTADNGGGSLTLKGEYKTIVDGDITVEDGGLLVEADQHITIGGSATSSGDMVLTADADGDAYLHPGNPLYGGNVSVGGDLTSTGGSITVSGYDETIYLGGDVTAFTDVLLNNNTHFKGFGDQHVTAQTGTITAKGWLDKSPYWCCEDYSWGSLYLQAEGDISLADYVTAGLPTDLPEIPFDHFGGVSIISDSGKIFTPGFGGKLNVAITGNSNHLLGTGVDLPKNYDDPVDDTGKAAIVVMSKETLKLGPGAKLTARGVYDPTGAVDDRPGVDFLDHPEGDKNPGWPIDIAIYLASNSGNVFVGSPVNPIPKGGVMVVDAFDTVKSFGAKFISSLVAGNVLWLEVCSRITPTLNHAVINNTLPYASDLSAYPGKGKYVLRGEHPDVGTGAWVLASNDEAPFGEAFVAGAEEQTLGSDGCPVLLAAVAEELGVPEDTIEVSIENSLALSTDIHPCESCARLVDAATILRDEDGSRMAAMAQVFNQLAPAEAPFTPEMASSIVTAFAGRVGDGTQYATAIEYIDAFVRYIAVLDAEMGSPVGDSTVFVMEKHGAGLAETENSNIAAFVASRLASLDTFGG